MKKIIYEYPLSERIRSLLRLEHLFTSVLYHIKGSAEWDSRTTVAHFIDLLELVNRFDFKTELIQELNSHVQILEQWQSSPAIDIERLTDLLEQSNRLITKLEQLKHPLIENFAGQYLVNLVQQRRAIIGGTSSCDLPSLYYWLQKNPKIRQKELNSWLKLLEPLQEASEFILYLIRNKMVISQKIAVEGFFQLKLDNNIDCQLVQVILPPEYLAYPEIKGGKKRFTIRFFEYPQTDVQPLQTEDDVNFELGCCCVG